MNTPLKITPLLPEDFENTARLLPRSLVSWYQSHLGQGARFGNSPEPFLLFPQVYAALDPGQALAARDASSGEMLGVCFVHPRETHVAIGIVASAPETAGRGVARAMMEEALALAKAAGKPVRLVSSLLNLDSFSLYSRLGFVPHTFYQDVSLTVPAQGFTAPKPAGVDRVRLARSDEAARLADFEQSLQGIRREPDYVFFLRHTVGAWKVWVCEAADGAMEGFIVASDSPAWQMLGPGVAANETAAAALLWRGLDGMRGMTPVFLLPCAANSLVRTVYSWGARNVELHAAQIVGDIPQAHGIAFPTFLPESG